MQQEERDIINKLLTEQSKCLAELGNKISTVLASPQFKEAITEITLQNKKIHEAFTAAFIEMNKKMASNTPTMSGTFRHVKRGTDYTIDRVINVQNSGPPIQDGELLLVYESINDKAGYGRRLDEFADGRFVRIDPEPEDPELPFWPEDV